MLDPRQRQALDALLAPLDRDQRIWLAGYVSALASGAGAVVQERAAPGGDAGPSGDAGPFAVAPSQGTTLHILYATETGNTRSVAQELERAAKVRGLRTRIQPLHRTKPEELLRLSDPAVFLTSTLGEGDPPEAAVRYFRDLKAQTTPLANLRYAVLGLGDTAYAKFCQAAVTLDACFRERGARAIHPLTRLSLDYAAHVPGWIDGILEAASAGPSGSAAIVRPARNAPVAPESLAGFNRLAPVTGRVREIVNLNDRGSNKATFHIEIGLDGPLPYEPGDSAGIILPARNGDRPVPRLYSIASSPRVHPDEVHLTVALAMHLNPDGTIGHGLCSLYLSLLRPGDGLQLYIHRNVRFRLPKDDSRDIIMIGPGTGIAPFRAFAQERADRGAAGRSWIFFGAQHRRTDFLYQAEWLDLLSSGALTRMDVAWSRDGTGREYVQDRLRDRGSELLDWLDGGAHLYLCGRKEPMAEEVEATLVELLSARHGNGREILDRWADEDRYVKDVY